MRIDLSGKSLILILMSLNAEEIALVVSELQRAVPGAEIRDVLEPREGVLVLTLRSAEASIRLLISTQEKASRLHLRSKRVKAPRTVSRFTSSLRGALHGCIIDGVEQVNKDRVVEFSLRGSGGEPVCLVAELMGPASNIFLLDSGRKIIFMLRAAGTAGRKPSPGQPYLPPRKRPEAGVGVREEFAGAEDICAEIERYYDERQESGDLRKAAAELASKLKSRRKRLERKREKMLADLENCSRHEELMNRAELLKANLPSIPKGAESARVVDYFDSGMKEVEIELDPRVSPRVCMERIFKRARKLKTALPVIRRRLEQVEEDIRRIDAALDTAARAESPEQLSEARTLAGKAQTKAPAVKRKKADTPSGARRFASAEGIEILVGRNNAGNDTLTMRVARGNDIWMHARNRAGSHVIVRIPRNRTASLDTLLDAANLAVYYSKVRRSSKVPVDYTQKKFVRKPKGSPPGKVTYSNNKTLIIDPDRSRLARLLGSE